MSQVRSAPSRSLGVAGKPRLNSAAGAKLAQLLIHRVAGERRGVELSGTARGPLALLSAR